MNSTAAPAPAEKELPEASETRMEEFEPIRPEKTPVSSPIRTCREEASRQEGRKREKTAIATDRRMEVKGIGRFI
jgi:hypothetical protein